MDTLCLGDSNTLGYSPTASLTRAQAWPSLYPNYFKPAPQVHIHAVCGCYWLDSAHPGSIRDGHSRLAVLARKHPINRLILQLGTNDLMSGELGSDILADSMAYGLKDLLSLQAHCEILVLLPAFQSVATETFWAGTSYGLLTAKAERFRRSLLPLLPEGVVSVDTLPFLEDSPDGVHLSARGHAALAQHLAELSC